MSLSTTIKSIQDIMRKDAGVDGDAQRIGQLGWMLFFKIFSDLEIETELEDDDYESPVPPHLRWNSWANEELVGKKHAPTGDDLVELVDSSLFPVFKDLDVAQFTGKARQRAELLRSVFEDAYNYMKSGTLMRQVINKINQNIDFNQSKTRHLFGDIYEQILRDLQSAGNAGEFYTPRAATQFAVDMVAPRLGETVLDPACGTGGFLTAAFEHMRIQAQTAEQLAQLKASIRGVEKKALPHLLGTTNLMLHGVEVPQISHGNTLARPLRDYGSKDQVDVIVTNPPFGGMEEDGIESNFPAEFRTRETADLFLVLVMELLRDGGRAAIVLPDGTLFGEGIKTRIKKRLLEECNLHTIVRLPKGVFAPYTTIKTNILFFTKGEPTKDVWFFEHPYPRGYKSYSKTKPMRIEEFEPEKAWWANREETEQAWRVTAEDIAAGGYNLDITNPNVVDDGHEESDILLARHAEATAEVEASHEAVRSAIADALLRRAGLDDLILLENFASVADAPGGVQHLRDLVLNLAFRGRLVPAGRLAPTAEHEVCNEPPFEIPSHWRWTTFRSVTESRLGKMLDNAKNTGSPRPYLRNANVQWFRFDLSDVHELRLEDEELDAYSVRQGDLVVCEGGEPGRLAVCNADVDGMVIQKALHRVRPCPDVDSWFLAYLMRLYARNGILAKFFTGATIKHLTGRALARVPVPLPPLDEQLTIVGKADELMRLCDGLDARRAALAASAERLAAALAVRAGCA